MGEIGEIFQESILDKNEEGADAFHTLVVVAEGIINSRPITPVSTDPGAFFFSHGAMYVISSMRFGGDSAVNA